MANALRGRKQGVAARVSERQRAVATLLRENPDITDAEISRRLKAQGFECARRATIGTDKIFLEKQHADEEEVFKLKNLHGLSMEEIGKSRGWSVYKAEKLFHAACERRRAGAVIDTQPHRVMQLERLNSIYAEAWNGWRRSVENAKRVKSEGSISGGRGSSYTERTDEITEHGDPRFLQQMHNCVDRIIRLLGLDAPSKHVHAVIMHHEIIGAIMPVFTTLVSEANLPTDEGAQERYVKMFTDAITSINFDKPATLDMLPEQPLPMIAGGEQ